MKCDVNSADEMPWSCCDCITSMCIFAALVGRSGGSLPLSACWLQRRTRISCSSQNLIRQSKEIADINVVHNLIDSLSVVGGQVAVKWLREKASASWRLLLLLQPSSRVFWQRRAHVQVVCILDSHPPVLPPAFVRWTNQVSVCIETS